MSTRQEQAVITKITDKQTTQEGTDHYQLEVQTDYGETFTLDTNTSHPYGVSFDLNEGQEVYLQILEDPAGNQVYLEDVVRTDALLGLVVLFAIITVIIGRSRGLRSLIGLAVTIAILFAVVFPQILSGADPVVTTALGSMVILAVNMHLAHGLNKRTALAVASTTVGLGLVVLFAVVFTNITALSGLASEENILLFWDLEAIRLPVGILMAGIILGAVGVLDDIAITQSEIVDELKQANPSMPRKELFKAAMRIGRHHIASTVNTLVLVYAGAALPLLLLYMGTQEGWGNFFNNEIVAQEIVRTLAGTCALVLLVPISTYLATFGQAAVDGTHKSH